MPYTCKSARRRPPFARARARMQRCTVSLSQTKGGKPQSPLSYIMLRGICSKRGLPFRTSIACRASPVAALGGGRRGSVALLQQRRWESSASEVPKAATAVRIGRLVFMCVFLCWMRVVAVTGGEAQPLSRACAEGWLQLYLSYARSIIRTREGSCSAAAAMRCNTRWRK